MLDLIVDGHWMLAVLGFLVGLFLAAYSVIFGIETAKGFKWLLTRQNACTGSRTPSSSSNWRVDSFKHHLPVIVVLILMLGLLWGVCGALLREEFRSGSSGAQLWLACFVGPPGVWIRWFLARLNGRGLGKAGLFKWVPFGTLAANVSAACIMAALSTVKKATCDIVASGIQLGFLGCLSTVSAFIAEFTAMRESKHPWRAYAYALITVCISFGLGILVYSVPVWTKGQWVSFKQRVLDFRTCLRFLLPVAVVGTRSACINAATSALADAGSQCVILLLHVVLNTIIALLCLI
ncbi:hypothetical protein CMV_014158 [Castanea mollissima]|uniref:CrcB-like protein n=1 Tax=Castanea mollissima TaxID=60419 RepID=A0A8J4R766_9ROSI|nr:hypothetical protein CMV_014158 [Castanea mollissima]